MTARLELEGGGSDDLRRAEVAAAATAGDSGCELAPFFFFAALEGVAPLLELLSAGARETNDKGS